MRNSVLDAPLLVEASSETRHFVPLRLKTGFYLACTACRSSISLVGRQVMSFEVVIIMSPVTIPSLILIVYGSGQIYFQWLPSIGPCCPLGNGCADPFHVAPSVAMIGLPCFPLCLVK